MSSPAILESTPELTNPSSCIPPLPSPPPTLDGSLPSASPPSSQSSSLACHSKIPKPRYCSRPFTHRIQPCDIDHFNAVKVLIRNTITKFLNCSRPWKEQDKAAISALTSAVASRSPIFDKYEDSWPILYYCYHHFHHRLSQFKRADHWQIKRRSPRKCRARRAIGSEQPVPSETRRKKGKGRKEKPRPGTSTSLEDEPLSIIQSERSPPAANDECGSNPVRPRSNDEQDILDFLLSMNRALGYLLDRFISAGIESKAQLLVATQWPRDERDIFFRTEVRLSPFEWKIVRDGLDKTCL